MSAHQAFLEAAKVEADEPSPLMREIPAAEAYPIIESALHSYSDQRRRGFKEINSVV